MSIIRYSIILLSLIFYTGFAGTYRSGEVIRLSRGDTLSEDLLGAARYIEIQGYLQADAFTGSEKITVDGGIEDDIIAAARDVVIKGSVGDMVVGFGQTVLIDGEVGGDLIAFGGEVRLTENAVISGNVFTGSGVFRLEGGRIGGRLTGGAGSVWLNGTVSGPVELDVAEVDFGPDFSAEEGMILTLPESLNKEEMAYVPENLQIKIEKESAFYQSGFFYWSLVSMFVTGLLCGLIFKQFTRNLLTFSDRNYLKNTGIGFVFVILFPLILALLIIPLITIPVALILAAIYAIIIYLGFIFAGLFMGMYIFSLFKKGQPLSNLILPFITGLIILVLLTKIPILGILVQISALSLGAGGIVTYLWSQKTGSAKTATG